MQRFCTQARNDWYRVYLVRKLTSLLGMESVQSLARPGHPARWVFPQEVIAQQVRPLLAAPGALAPCPLRGRPAAALGLVSGPRQPHAAGDALDSCRRGAVCVCMRPLLCPLPAKFCQRRS